MVKNLEEAMVSIRISISANALGWPAFWYKFLDDSTSPPEVKKGSVKKDDSVWLIPGKRKSFPFGSVVGELKFNDGNPFKEGSASLRSMGSRTVGEVEEKDYSIELNSGIEAGVRSPCVLRVDHAQESPHGRIGFRFGETHSVTIISFDIIDQLAVENNYGEEVAFCISAGGSHVPIKLNNGDLVELDCQQLGASLKFTDLARRGSTQTDLMESNIQQSGGTDHIQIFIEGNGPSGGAERRSDP